MDPATIWRWDQAVASGGVAGLVPALLPQRPAPTSLCCAWIILPRACIGCRNCRQVRSLGSAPTIRTFTAQPEESH